MGSPAASTTNVLPPSGARRFLNLPLTAPASWPFVVAWTLRNDVCPPLRNQVLICLKSLASLASKDAKEAKDVNDLRHIKRFVKYCYIHTADDAQTLRAKYIQKRI